MLDQTSSGEGVTRPKAGLAYLCLYGHFYQPPREDPFTNVLPLEPGATPFINYNEKIQLNAIVPMPRQAILRRSVMTWDRHLPRGWRKNTRMSINESSMLITCIRCAMV